MQSFELSCRTCTSKFLQNVAEFCTGGDNGINMAYFGQVATKN